MEGQAVEIVRRRLITDLAWMPDGSRVIVAGFDKDTRAAWSFPRLGGEGQRLRSASDLDVAYAAVAPDGSAVALTSMDQKGFQVVTLDGQRSEPVRLEGFQWLYDFDWTGDDRIALSTVDARSAFIVWTVSPTGQDLRRLHVSKDPLAGLCSSPDGRALYLFRNRNDATELVRIRTDSGSEAQPEVVLAAVPVVFSATARLDCSISRDGERMLYSRGSAEANLWKLEINSKVAPPVRLTSGTSLFSYPDVSPDGQWIVASVGTEANSQIFRMPVAGGEPVKLRAGGPPSWSPDGKRLAFVAPGGGSLRVFVSDADGQGAVEVRGAQPTNPFLTWLPDGRLAWPTPDARDFRIRSPDDPSRPEEGLQQGKPIGWILYAVFSPRGDRIAVTWNRNDRMSLWVMTWPGREARELVRDLWPFAWSADGEWIYAHNEKRDVFRVSATSGRSETVATFPTGTLEAGCDITPDRKTVICAVQEQHSDAWLAEHFAR
jgi:Tol biopolymer transport system component